MLSFRMFRRRKHDKTGSDAAMTPEQSLARAEADRSREEAQTGHTHALHVRFNRIERENNIATLIRAALSQGYEEGKGKS